MTKTIQHGGKRPGAGRKASAVKTKYATIQIEKELVEKLKVLKKDQSYTKLITSLVDIYSMHRLS